MLLSCLPSACMWCMCCTDLDQFHCEAGPSDLGNIMYWPVPCCCSHTPACSFQSFTMHRVILVSRLQGMPADVIWRGEGQGGGGEGGQG